MSYQVSEADLKTIRLNEQDTVSSVLHNVALILATPKGTIPMYRDFGLDREFLDMPIPEAEVRMIAPIREAVQEWEPRATVKDVFSPRAETGAGGCLHTLKSRSTNWGTDERTVRTIEQKHGVPICADGPGGSGNGADCHV